ncbi:MAG: B12 binding domain protein [Syntrophaceae bacterium PtaU1.Bin231]|nr:MAG: B12 binding domain protein [Syntrophaceae bacterium PtaU1.Bin231]HOG16815.1 cobalamin-dependent protein [Syntrophales bacterium]
MTASQVRHPLGTGAKILLSSVFGPYARDDGYGSRAINPMELYHNQVTRVQGGFSLRMFHRSFGLMMIQDNLDAPCTLLDFPSLGRFTEEIRHHSYDIVGISAIVPNVGKVKVMCQLIRQYLPNATIVIGGHIANLEELPKMVDADHIVKGDGIRWFRRYLGQDEKASIRHPLAYSGFDTRILGFTLREKPKKTAAILIPSVGCPVGCNFCSTSALFGGKGHFINFYETGDELFSVMRQLEKKLGVQSFFVLDENFLLHKKRSLRLLELMKEHRKSWSLYVFSSARVLQSYSIEQLVGLGISFVWMGLESEVNGYRKLSGVDTHALIRTLQSNGIRVLGSTIIGLEDHTPETVERVIDHAVSHNTDFHQFMLYTPIPGTPLYERHRREGNLLTHAEFPLADTHGQYRFNYRHRHIPRGLEEQLLAGAFRRDFDVNGPSLFRIIRTQLHGWSAFKDHPDRRIRERFRREAKSLRTGYAAAVWAMKKWYRDQPLSEEMDDLLRDLYRQFGWVTRLSAPLVGRFLYRMLKKEEKRLAEGWTLEPGSFCEKNAAALALGKSGKSDRKAAIPENRWVTCIPAPVAEKS